MENNEALYTIDLSDTKQCVTFAFSAITELAISYALHHDKTGQRREINKLVHQTLDVIFKDIRNHVKVQFEKIADAHDKYRSEVQERAEDSPSIQ